ncbi:sugar diacid utilization regulator [Bacilli bacterium PM5-3]|nr:sugar diacid utilization regulator [Bacilli bacterium PM5-3]MDH6604087.1 sugar diacid utilization regulator [Bacilli bacterium PM5-9]
MIRNVYILVEDLEKKEKLVRYLNLNNKYIQSITTLNNGVLLIKESYTKFEQLLDYEHIYQQFANEIKTDMSILVVNDGIFKDLESMVKEFLVNTYCNVYDASSLVYYCFVTNENDEIIDQFYSYFSKLDEELLKSVYMYLDNNLNALKTARDLFLHRNTLNYRLNKFQFVSGVDIRTTQSASLIHSYRIRHHYRFVR